MTSPKAYVGPWCEIVDCEIIARLLEVFSITSPRHATNKI